MATISATTPTVLDTTYNLWVLSSLSVIGDGCIGLGQRPAQGQTSPTPSTVSVAATLTKACILGDGVTYQRSPSPQDTISLSIPDLYAFLAGSDPQVANVAAALSTIMTALVGLASEQGLL